MQLIYIFEIEEEISELDRLHHNLDTMVENSLASNNIYSTVVRSTLESPYEISEHDYQEGS